MLEKLHKVEDKVNRIEINGKYYNLYFLLPFTAFTLQLVSSTVTPMVQMFLSWITSHGPFE